MEVVRLCGLSVFVLITTVPEGQTCQWAEACIDQRGQGVREIGYKATGLLPTLQTFTTRGKLDG